MKLMNATAHTDLLITQHVSCVCIYNLTTELIVVNKILIKDLLEFKYKLIVLKWNVHTNTKPKDCSCNY